MIESDDPYICPGTTTLRNLLGIVDSKKLNKIERRLVTDRIAEGAPLGSFDLIHLCAIHHYLFQDVDDWAGKLRTVEINKDGHQFQFRQYVQAGMADVHRRLVKSHFLKELSRREFTDQSAVIIGDVNYVHPFREGNGRTQMQYLKQLAEQAGHNLDLRYIDAARWIEASRASFTTDYTLTADLIHQAIARSSAE